MEEEEKRIRNYLSAKIYVADFESEVSGNSVRNINIPYVIAKKLVK